MAEVDDIISRIKGNIGPLIKSREQVNYIRRIIAVHLAQDGHNQLLKPPFSLVETTDNIVDSTSNSSKLRKEYLEAMNANINTRKEFDQVRDNVLASSGGIPSKSDNPSDLLPDHLATLRLRQQRDALFALQSSLEILSEKPAAMEDFLDADQMFNTVAELPTVPKEVLNTIVLEQTTTPKDLNTTINQLEKTVLRAKLSLRHEEQLLQRARANFKQTSASPHKLAKLEALGATRNQLIDWIETNLSHTVDDNNGDENNGTESTANVDHSTTLSQLNRVQEKYLKYVAARQQVLQTLDNELPSLAISTAQEDHTRTKRETQSFSDFPTDHLLTSRVQSLLQASKMRKSLVAQKSHTSTTVAKCAKSTSRKVAEAAKGSELLSKHAPSNREETGLPRQTNLLDLSQSWTSAADSAKITSLEDVAAQLETGQNALEHSMNVLYQIQQLTGDTQTEEDRDVTQMAEEETLHEDTWVGAGYSQKQHSRAASENKLPKSFKRNDMWSKIHGNLGLLGHDGL